MNEQGNLRRKKWRNIVVIAIIILIAAVGWAGSQAWAFLRSLNDGNDLDLIDAPEENETINCLFVGVDELPGRSDTMILVSYNPLTEKVLSISIPRDTYANVPGYWRSSGKPYGMQKINHAHSFGGLPLAMETVENFLGLNIHYFARIDYSALHKFVDAIGGVPIDIKSEMDYDDYAGDVHIHFKIGPTTLNGQEAEEFLRWRQNNDHTGDGLGDIGRIQRQQEFLKSAVRQLLKVKNLFNIGDLQKIATESVDTNMPASFMLKMFKDVVIGFDYENNLNFITVPGEFSDSAAYWLVEGENRLMLDTIVQEHLAPDLTQNINVRVLNGTAESGLASEVAEKLNKYPHISATAGNAANSNVEVTEVVSYTEDSIAKYVAAMVGGENNLYRGDDQTITDDVIIILGKDYGA